MNVFQRAGIFIVRLIAVAMIVIAVMGGCMYVVHVFRGTLDPIVTARAVAAIEWFIAGVVLFALSKPLGRLMGAGLG